MANPTSHPRVKILLFTGLLTALVFGSNGRLADYLAVIGIGSPMLVATCSDKGDKKKNRTRTSKTRFRMEFLGFKVHFEREVTLKTTADNSAVILK